MNNLIKRSSQLFVLSVLAALVSCATKTPPIAEISVFVGDPPRPDKLDEYHLMSQKTILTSHEFAMHLVDKFSLAQAWKMSPEEACKKIMDAVTVDVGGDTGRYTVELPGLERKQEVMLLNELCDYYSRKDDLMGIDENSNPQRMMITVFKRAE